MDATLRGRAEELAKEMAVTISTQEELSDVMRLMTKTMIECILDAEMKVHLGSDPRPGVGRQGKTAPVEPEAAAAAEPAEEP